MKTVRVSLGHRSYDILIGNSVLQKTDAFLQERLAGRRIFLVANTTVYELYGKTLEDRLTGAGFEVIHLLIPDGERHKTLGTVENIYTYLIAQKADRRSTLVALGGGVTGDVVGFVAATFLRGVPYVQIPTTLLSQVDSSVGGKTGVNHSLGKNLIGAFYQPCVVCIDTGSLLTLPDREYRSGLYEVLKYGLIYDRVLFEYFASNLADILKRDSAVLENVISRCCEIKAEVISIDETEEDLRRILNFGHTLGHALEAATKYGTFTHGEAVGLGMLAATSLSHNDGLIDEATMDVISDTILRIGPLPSAAGVPFEDMVEAIKRDKKRQEDKTFFVLLQEVGKTVICSGHSEELLKEVWEQTVERVEN